MATVPLRDTSWQRFLRDTMGDDTQKAAADRTGILQANISRWLAGHTTPSIEAAVRFARGYGIHPITALVAAGILTPREANTPAAPLKVNLSAATSTQLARELARRADTEKSAS